MKITSREKVFVAAGAALAVLLVAGEWGVHPLWSRWEELHRRAESAETQLHTMRALLERYRRGSAELKRMEARLIREDDDFSLFAFLEEAAGRVGIRGQLVSMNPSVSDAGRDYRRIEMLLRFNDLTLAQLVAYLQELEKAPRLIRVLRMSLERSMRRPGRIGASFSVAAFAAKDARR